MGQNADQSELLMSSYERGEYRRNSEVTRGVLSPRDSTKTLWRPESAKDFGRFPARHDQSAFHGQLCESLSRLCVQKSTREIVAGDNGVGWRVRFA